MRSTPTTMVKSRPRELAATAGIALALLLLPGVAQAAKPVPPPPAPPATPTTYAGSAYALSAYVGVLGGAIQAQVGPISNTGELPSGGGMIDRELVGLNTGAPLAINAGILDASTTGSGSKTISDASVLSANINVANLVTVGADVIQATAKASCVNGAASYKGTSTSRPCRSGRSACRSTSASPRNRTPRSSSRAWRGSCSTSSTSPTGAWS